MFYMIFLKVVCRELLHILRYVLLLDVLIDICFVLLRYLKGNLDCKLSQMDLSDCGDTNSGDNLL